MVLHGEKYLKMSHLLPIFRNVLVNWKQILTSKANIANPNFTGTAKLEGKDLATKEYADSIVAAAKSEVPIVIDADHPFPAKAYKAGQKYVVALAGTYLGQKCEVGDLILIIKDSMWKDQLLMQMDSYYSLMLTELLRVPILLLLKAKSL